MGGFMEIRSINAVGPEHFPYVVITGLPQSTGNVYPRNLAWLKRSIDRDQTSQLTVLPNKDATSEPAQRLDVRGAAEHLENIRAVLNPAVGELASVFDVSRQSVYKWLSRESEPEPAKLERIQAFSRAADAFRDAGIERGRALSQLKAFDGDSLLDLVRAGKDWTAAVETLISEAQHMDAAYLRSGLAMSKANPTADWKSDASIPAAQED
jgi:transcriptional regulator with XRE-family HTH domain